MRAVARERCGQEFIVDSVRERCAEDGNGGSENEAGGIALANPADGLEQPACAVEVDAIPLVEIDFRLGGYDGRKMKDHVWPSSQKLLRCPWSGKVGRKYFDRE